MLFVSSSFLVSSVVWHVSRQAYFCDVIGLYCNVFAVGERCALRVYVKLGPVRDLNPGPLAPEAKIIPLDQQADV